MHFQGLEVGLQNSIHFPYIPNLVRPCSQFRVDSIKHPFAHKPDLVLGRVNEPAREVVCEVFFVVLEGYKGVLLGLNTLELLITTSRERNVARSYQFIALCVFIWYLCLLLCPA